MATNQLQEIAGDLVDKGMQLEMNCGWTQKTENPSIKNWSVTTRRRGKATKLLKKIVKSDSLYSKECIVQLKD